MYFKPGYKVISPPSRVSTIAPGIEHNEVKNFLDGCMHGEDEGFLLFGSGSESSTGGDLGFGLGRGGGDVGASGSGCFWGLTIGAGGGEGGYSGISS